MHLGNIEEALGIGGAQELAHLDGARLAILVSLPAKPRAREPPGRRRQSVFGNPTE